MKLSPDAKYFFLFAHPDDEVVISGTMKLLLDSGADIHAAWATSGNRFTKREIRESELKRSMDVLGLDQSRTHLLRIPDLGLVSLLEDAVDCAANLLNEVRPDVIFVDAYEGGHPDHDSVNFLAHECSARIGIKPQLLEFPCTTAPETFFTGSGVLTIFRRAGPRSCTIHCLMMPFAANTT